MFFGCDYLHKSSADGLHELFGVGYASSSIGYSYSKVCYLTVAAHGAVDMGARGSKV